MECKHLGKIVFDESKKADAELRVSHGHGVTDSASQDYENWQWRALYKATVFALGVSYYLALEPSMRESFSKTVFDAGNDNPGDMGDTQCSFYTAYAQRFMNEGQAKD
jgi:hypothetical protein